MPASLLANCDWTRVLLLTLFAPVRLLLISAIADACRRGDEYGSLRAALKRSLKPDQRSNNERDRYSVDDDQVLAAIEAAYAEVSLNLILVSTPSIQ
jgi:hypothetical protein